MVATGFGVVKGIEALIGFFDFLGSVAEGVGAMYCGGDRDGHLWGEDRAVGALDALGCYFEYS